MNIFICICQSGEVGGGGGGGGKVKIDSYHYRGLFWPVSQIDKKPLYLSKACQGARKAAVTSKLDDTRTLE